MEKNFLDINTNAGKMMHSILGLMGAIGAGKDYVADTLINEYRYIAPNLNVVKMKFATGLIMHVLDYYQESHDLLPFFQDRQWKHTPRFFHPEKEDVRLSPREALCYFGTKEKDKDHNVWVNALHARIMRMMLDYPTESCWLFIISDVRYQNEVDYINKSGGSILPIRNRLAEEREMSKDSYHESEELVRSCIQNNYRDYELVFNNDEPGLDYDVVRAYAKVFLPCPF